jgi:hypothetical protein
MGFEIRVWRALVKPEEGHIIEQTAWLGSHGTCGFACFCGSSLQTEIQ